MVFKKDDSDSSGAMQKLKEVKQGGRLQEEAGHAEAAGTPSTVL